MCYCPDAFTTKTRKARKEHKCCECYHQIKKGEYYQYSSGIWDHEPSSYKQCITCYAIFSLLPCDEFDGVAFGELKELFYNEVCQSFSLYQVIDNYSQQLNINPSFLGALFTKEELA